MCTCCCFWKTWFCWVIFWLSPENVSFVCFWIQPKVISFLGSCVQPQFMSVIHWWLWLDIISVIYLWLQPHFICSILSQLQPAWHTSSVQDKMLHSLRLVTHGFWVHWLLLVEPIAFPSSYYPPVSWFILASCYVGRIKPTSTSATKSSTLIICHLSWTEFGHFTLRDPLLSHSCHPYLPLWKLYFPSEIMMRSSTASTIPSSHFLPSVLQLQSSTPLQAFKVNHHVTKAVCLYKTIFFALTDCLFLPAYIFQLCYSVSCQLCTTHPSHWLCILHPVPTVRLSGS